MSKPTPEQLDYARRWVAARGKRPSKGDDHWYWMPGYTTDFPDQIPPVLMTGSVGLDRDFPTEEDAVAALAVVLARFRAAVAIPGEGV